MTYLKSEKLWIGVAVGLVLAVYNPGNVFGTVRGLLGKAA